jgi:hypothetical protein
MGSFALRLRVPLVFTSLNRLLRCFVECRLSTFLLLGLLENDMLINLLTLHNEERLRLTFWLRPLTQNPVRYHTTLRGNRAITIHAASRTYDLRR